MISAAESGHQPNGWPKSEAPSTQSPRHGRYAWVSLFSVALVDLYIYLLAINAFDDPRFF